MRVGVVPENMIERAALRARLVPIPLLESFAGMLLARFTMAGAKLGIFDALAAGPLRADEVAARCETDAHATGKLLFALAGHGYLRAEDGRYALEPVARKWLLRESPHSLTDNMLLRYLEWELVENLEEYVRTGATLDLHHRLESDAEWDVYQRGMRALASFGAPEVVRRTPVPKGAREMLDIGGSHGYFSVAFCRRHPELRATVLDLPQALKHAAPILAKEGMGDRVAHRAGDALTADLGEEAYDLIFIGNLVHHFDDAQNRALAQRVARALRPGGVYAIFDEFSGDSPRKTGQAGAALELYFALLSQSGTWAPRQMAAWQQEAGLEPRKPVRLRTLPAQGLQVATKPSR
jgi:hypothetical protein